MPELVSRRVTGHAEEFLDAFRVVIVNGPRQSGKTTLLRQLNGGREGTYLTLDDGSLRSAAQADPAVFIADGARPMMIDEIQRGGDELILAIKAEVDRKTERGQFVLAGSTRFLSTPSLSESLAGRAGILEVWPFAQEELAGTGESFLVTAFNDPEALRSSSLSDYGRRDYFELVCRGFYPEAVAMRSEFTRDRWYRTYVQSVIDTDIREMARVDEPSSLRQLLNLAAANTAQEPNTVKIGSDLQLHRSTVNRYVGLLETVFLIRQVPAWSRNLVARAVRRPKLHVTDTGLAAHLIGVDADGLAARVSPARGPLVESFIVNEIAKQATWAPFRVGLHHWRVSQGAEVDLVLERNNGRIVGVEAKATDSVNKDDFKGLVALRESLGEDFVHGFVFYTGVRSLSFGDRLTALPLSALWDR
ncbi:ATP-binding protein [Streptosporangium sp. NBC_01755]|uniref:ATP-binding protein n=1 Tax=unclassified Streptosporangium TaxID=2632669 RepID=UPI002DDBA516|nr:MULTISPECIES: ATP-binding protein [unclassified Streptosporangium]WSA25450.1 ATP-binding protein [Streptosporangium sp. NBC_01810]WSD03161.1 ATP-binding protein [Streptosporangium sp. NBC_01755]